MSLDDRLTSCRSKSGSLRPSLQVLRTYIVASKSHDNDATTSTYDLLEEGQVGQWLKGRFQSTQWSPFCYDKWACHYSAATLKKDPLRLEKQEGIYRLLVGPEMRKFWRSRWKDATDASIFHLSKRNLTRITIWFKWRRSVKFNLRTFDSKHFCFPFERNNFVNILHGYLDSKCIFYTRN